MIFLLLISFAMKNFKTFIPPYMNNNDTETSEVDNRNDKRVSLKKHTFKRVNQN